MHRIQNVVDRGSALDFAKLRRAPYHPYPPTSFVFILHNHFYPPIATENLSEPKHTIYQRFHFIFVLQIGIHNKTVLKLHNQPVCVPQTTAALLYQPWVARTDSCAVYCVFVTPHPSPSKRDVRRSLLVEPPQEPVSCCSLSGHQLFISVFMIASKVICDDAYSNKSCCSGLGCFC